MASDKPAKPGEALSPLWLKSLFPDAQGIFDAEHRSLDDIRDSCFVALDANVLLLPFKLEEVSLSIIVKVYERLVQKNQIIIPAQAAREFAKHRSSKVAEIAKYLRDQASYSGPSLKKKVGALEERADYKSAKLAADALKSGIKKLQDQINAIADDISSVIGNDPVSVAYRGLFAGVVSDDPADCQDEEALSKELDLRNKMRRPPGFNDQAKEDGGAGDLIIWKTVLAEGKKRKTDCIFVTGYEKNDWYVQSVGPFQPRLELVEEFRTVTGKTLHIIPLSRLLKLFEAPSNTVDDVKRVEAHEEQRSRTRTLFDRVNAAKEISILQAEYSRVSQEITLTQNRLSNSIPFDGNMHLPWNRAYVQDQTLLRDLMVERAELNARIGELNDD